MNKIKAKNSEKKFEDEMEKICASLCVCVGVGPYGGRGDGVAVSRRFALSLSLGLCTWMNEVSRFRASRINGQCLRKTKDIMENLPIGSVSKHTLFRRSISSFLGRVQTGRGH